MFAELPIGRPHDGCDPHEEEPRAVRFLRVFGIVGMTVVVVLIAAGEPHPGLGGERLVVLLGLLALAAGIVVGQPQRVLPPGVRLVAVLAVTLGALAVMVEQPEGAAVGGLYFAVVVAALRFQRPLAVAILLLAVVGSGVAAGLSDSDMDAVGMAVGLFFALVPWLLVLGLVRDLARGREELRASRAAEAEAAAQAERGRLAREMHDVLAHSLSGLALQLEGARLLARDRDTDPAVVEAIERARHLATSGLDE
ncbi:MAG TPA: histidine kinase dimerization/phosphoacceptor domain-containing protein, partial [Solirubrobacteraceae bacterium]|nr:histidine kinase dimerization/phosphoacceptor domain-containing protein [Solirubrobacteraceae bacterium]